ncbi:cobyrinate a,c-diamide synthase [Solicola sp. PLA-1-18]|uniref:cobyrinate a,c-diamide synthase n=1 Tax=Solicola sp. PLA-1-18 TaxID=3380532 RepID=UPI003B78B7BB
MVTPLPRVVVAAPASGHGKTTVATGLMAALRRAGHEVSGHKVGPDYIDPGYHALATGRPGRNLDPHMVGEQRLVPLLLHGAATPRQADVAVVEGVMGLFDGALGREGFASTAHVAGLIQAPVVLVVDVSSASRSIAAVVHGMATFDPRVRIAGVILNKVGSPRHGAEVVSALEATGVPVLGVLARDDGVSAPSRHLGLVPAAERGDAAAALDRLAAQVAEHVDLAEVLRIARSAPDLDAEPWSAAEAVGREQTSGGEAPLVAVAGGRAFTFRYAETTELLHAAGLRTAYVDPTTDEALPPGTAGIYLGGGFPEVHAAGLSANEPLRHALREAVRRGVPTVGECAGLLYLTRSVDGASMVGAIDATAVMTPRLTLGYRTAVAPADTLLAPAGGRITGHEFHRTTVDPPHDSADGASAAWIVDGRQHGFSADPAGTGSPTLHAAYLHTHWAGHPRSATRFADAVHAAVADGRVATSTVAPRPAPARVGPDLHHHGDSDQGSGLTDFAVNVQRLPRPDWLERALADSIRDTHEYPDASQARQAIADRHVRHPDEVLPTAGGAEAFTLVARMRPWRAPVVVHPQFTEPEAALRAAGHDVRHVLCRPEGGFALHPDDVPEDADLVMVGNPTNPTGALHTAATIRQLLRPGRVVVVDEAFMDAVSGERQSLTAQVVPGLLVVRSLTKTWSVPGVRAGYVVGEAGLVAELAAQQPPWSVSSSAAATMLACSTGTAVAEAERRAVLVARHRAVLVQGLADLGLPVAGSPATPFVLVRVGEGVRERVRAEGHALRRGDSFPGLGPEWVRIAVRDPATTRELLAALVRTGVESPTVVKEPSHG